MQVTSPVQEDTPLGTGVITLVGPLTTPLAVTKPEHPATKGYVMANLGSGVSANHSHPLATFVGAEALTAALGEKLTGLNSDVQNQINTKVKLSGGTLGASGLKLPSTGTQPLSAITLSKLNAKISEASVGGSTEPGTIAMRNANRDNTGWLPLEVPSFKSKTQYAALYAAVGSTFEDLVQINILYQGYGMAGGGVPFANQYEWRKSLTLTSGFSHTATLPFGLAQGQLVVTKSYVYYIGGFKFADGTTTIELNSSTIRFPISSDGSLGNGVVDNSVNGDLTAAPESCFKVVTVLNKVYLFSGGNIYRSTINADGTITPFANIGSHGVSTSLFSSLFVTKNTLYMAGGYENGAQSNKIYASVIGQDGSLGAFVLSPSVLPEALSMPEIVTVRNKVYLFAGVRSFSDGGYGSNKIYSATIGSDGKISAFTDTGKTLPENLFFSFANIVTKNKIVIIGGGYDARGERYHLPELTLIAINLDDTGTITSTEKLTTQLLDLTARSNALVLRNKLHVIGGLSNVDLNTGNDTAISGWVQTATLAEGGLVDLSVFASTTVNKLDGTNLHGTYVLGNNNPDPVNLFRLPGIPCLAPAKTLSNGLSIYSGDRYYIKT